MSDIFDNGTPKYSTAQDIYDALCTLAYNEEAGILGEMFEDVSYDGQDYYYTDRGHALKEKFEELSDYGNNMWLMDLAVWQINEGEIHDLIFDALRNADMAKRLGFKKLFIDIMLSGNKAIYDEIAEMYGDELAELNRFSYWENLKAFERVMEACGRAMITNPYNTLCNRLIEKARGLRLQDECRLISECRALLTSYDDFMLGLKMNQALHDGLEQRYRAKQQYLQESYEKTVRQLLMIAESQGVKLSIGNDTLMLEEANP